MLRAGMFRQEAKVYKDDGEKKAEACKMAVRSIAGRHDGVTFIA